MPGKVFTPSEMENLLQWYIRESTRPPLYLHLKKVNFMYQGLQYFPRDLNEHGRYSITQLTFASSWCRRRREDDTVLEATALGTTWTNSQRVFVRLQFSSIHRYFLTWKYYLNFSTELQFASFRELDPKRQAERISKPKLTPLSQL